MKFLGGLLNVLAVLILVAATAICTAVVVLAEGVPEAILVMGLAWVCALLVALNIMGTGIALLQISKLKKKIQWLERMPMAAAAGGEFPAAAMPESSVDPVPPVPPVPQDTYTAAKPESKKGTVIAVGAVAAVAVVALIVVLAGGNREVSDNRVYENETFPTYQPMLSDPTEPETVPEESTTGGELVNLAMGEGLSTEFVEMRFDDVAVAADIKLSVTTGNVTRITGPDPLDGQQYICLTGKVMNTSTSPLPVYDFFVGKFDIDGYNYDVSANDCDVLTPDGRTVTEIDPLMEYDFRIYTAIPNALADSFGTCTFSFGFYDGFANEDLSYSRAFSEDPIAECPYRYDLLVR